MKKWKLPGVAVAALLHGCLPAPPSTPDAAAPAAWSLTDRAIRYEVRETRPTPAGTPTTRTVAIEVALRGGAATVTEDGVATTGSLSRAGRLSKTNQADPGVYYELPLLAVVPPDATAEVGERWEVVSPTDAEAAASTALVAQQRVTYEVLAVSPTRLEVSLKGEVRIAPSAGLSTLTTGAGLPEAVVLPLATRWKPHLDARATFDLSDGSTLAATGTLIPLAVLFDGQDLSQHPARVEYTAHRK